MVCIMWAIFTAALSLTLASFSPLVSWDLLSEAFIRSSYLISSSSSYRSPGQSSPFSSPFLSATSVASVQMTLPLLHAVFSTFPTAFSVLFYLAVALDFNFEAAGLIQCRYLISKMIFKPLTVTM